jgi:hypothetical protein
VCSELNVISDERVKKDIKDLDDDNCLSAVNQLKQKGYKKYDEDNVKIGFIAQDVEQILPTCVYKKAHKVSKGKHKDSRNIVDEEIEDFRCMDYTQLIPILTGAIKSLNKKIEGMEKEIDKLRLRR